MRDETPKESVIKKWPVFICYRQIDGTDVADYVAKLLDNQVVRAKDPSSAIEEEFTLVVYQDVNATTAGDWVNVHQANLKRARAFIVICTAASSIDHRRRRRDDWVHKEIDWWLEFRPEIAPILIDALGTGDLYIPDTILDRWPNAQRIPLIASEWNKFKAAELTDEKSRITNLLKREVTRSREEFIALELADAARREAKLAAALIRKNRWFYTASIFALTACLAAAVAYYSRSTTLDTKAEIDELIRRVNVGGQNVHGKTAMRNICKEAITVSSSLVNDNGHIHGESVSKFWELYYGSMNIVEIRQQTEQYSGDSAELVRSSIETAMVKIGNALIEIKNNERPIQNRLSLPQLSKELAMECDGYTGEQGK